MTISKRLRFEILRRDGYRCCYCGVAATEGAVLTIDHVVPLALGGTDDPSNLVAACADCNAGKSSAAPDAPTIDEAGARALEWRNALQAASRDVQDDHERIETLVEAVRNEWLEHYRHVSSDLEAALRQFDEASLPLGEIVEAVRITARRDPDDPFTYFCKVCWNKVGEFQERVAARSPTAPTPAPDENVPVPDVQLVEPVVASPEEELIERAIIELNSLLLPDGWRAVRDDWEYEGERGLAISVQRPGGDEVASLTPFAEPSAPWEALIDYRADLVHGDLPHVVSRAMAFEPHLGNLDRQPPYWRAEEDSAYDQEWRARWREQRAEELREAYVELVPDASQGEIAAAVRDGLARCR